MRLLLVGDGRMGRALDALARERGHEVVALLGAADNRHAAAIGRFTAAEADVALEFTEPGVALANVVACLRSGLPVVSGTTGWYDALPVAVVETERNRGALFWSPNFSLGVALLQEVARRAAGLFAPHRQFDVHLVETHHAAKKDAPSGTAAALAAAAAGALGRPVPVTSVRVGQVPGTHTLLFDGPFEQIAITHEARDRRVFADGALGAAEWLVGRRGVYTMRDWLGGADKA